MIINIKYHIASLVAVFLALGIGIVIGIALLGNDSVTKTQETIIKDLRNNYDKINTENKDAQADIKKLQSLINNNHEYEKKTLPLFMDNKLQGQQIAIIETNVSPAKEELVNSLTKVAGANVISDTIILNGLSINDQNKRDQIAEELNLKGKNKDEISKELATLITQNLTNGQNKKLIDLLLKEGLIKINGNFGVPVSAVIIIGGSSDDKNNKEEIIDAPIINYLNEQKIPVYGVESTDVAVSYMKSYQKMKITTVDNIDQISGQAALIWAIEKQLPGNYGLKNTAKQLLPNM